MASCTRTRQPGYDWWNFVNRYSLIFKKRNEQQTQSFLGFYICALCRSRVPLEPKVSDCLLGRNNSQISLKDHKCSKWIYHVDVHHPEICNNNAYFQLWGQLLTDFLSENIKYNSFLLLLSSQAVLDVLKFNFNYKQTHIYTYCAFLYTHRTFYIFFLSFFKWILFFSPESQLLINLCLID